MPIDKNGKRWVGPSKSDSYLENRSVVPQVSALMANSVSQERRVILANEVDRGLFRDGSAVPDKYGPTNNSIVTASVGMKKTAQALSSGGGGGFRGSGDTIKQAPEVYSPLWLNSNLSLPRDRATINAWCRSFYALNPFVQNAINLHSTYPISKLNIKCHNKEVENFFNEMIEEIDLMNICVQVAQEYWLLGEAFPYAEMDNNKGKWNRLLIQNPDYMIVQRTVVADEPLIMLRPDENLKKIIFSNKPSDVEQRKQLNQHIIDSVKRGNNIPLDNFHVSHLARRISPYEIRGTGLPVSIFRNLMLFDKLRECYSEDTEVLTDKGFKKISDLVHQTSNINLNPNYVNGVKLDENNQISSILTMKEDFKVACVNPENHKVEYHKPIELHMSQYTGKMVHFIGKKVDCLVSPNHKMWIDSGKGYERETAINLSNRKRKHYKLLSKVEFDNNYEPKNINICGKEVPIELYLKILGYLVSEGCIYENFTKHPINVRKNRYDAFIDVCQFTNSDCYEDMRETFNKFAEILDKKTRQKIITVDTGYRCKTGIYADKWDCKIQGKDLTEFFKNQIGSLVNDKVNTKSHFKKLPRVVFDLSPRLMKILLDALVKGDGSETKSKYGTENISYKYSTVSKQLADDVYELVYKIGYVPNICISRKIGYQGEIVEYIVLWSTTNYGHTPNINSSIKNKENGGGAEVKEVDYDGIVWCFEVPTGLFITRRNGKVTVQGNSKFAQADNMVNPLTLIKIGSEGPDGLHPTFADIEAWREVFESAQSDKDFKIFTHPGVSIEKIGSGSGIYDISGDITQLMKEIFIGLQIPQVLMDGADITYANGGVAMDALRQRYISFRNMLSAWLRRKIFAPISKMQEFYEYSNGEKKLIVPEVDWNHMSLFDTGDYITNLVTLTQGEGDQKRVSLHTLYRSIGLEYEDEIRKMRKEAIQNAIAAKEKEALQAMDLNALRSLDDDDEIIAPENTEGGGSKESPLPGETPGGSSLPGLDLGSLSGGGSNPSVPATSPEASAGTPPKT